MRKNLTISLLPGEHEALQKKAQAAEQTIHGFIRAKLELPADRRRGRPRKPDPKEQGQ